MTALTDNSLIHTGNPALRKKVAIVHVAVLSSLFIAHFVDWSPKPIKTMKVAISLPAPSAPDSPKAGFASPVPKVEPKPQPEVVKPKPKPQPKPKTVSKPKPKKVVKKKTTPPKKKTVKKPTKKRETQAEKIARIRNSVKKRQPTRRPTTSRKVELDTIDPTSIRKNLDSSIDVKVSSKVPRTSGQSASALANYNAMLGSYLNNRWSHNFRPSEEFAVVTLIIYRSGSIKSKRISRRSGNSMLDSSVQRVLNSLRKALPLPSNIKSSPYEVSIKFKP